MGAGTVLSIAKGAKEAQRELARAGGAKREAALKEISSALRENVQSILEANRADIVAARENGMAESMIDRLTLTAERIEGMAKGVDDVAAMPDPVGRVLSGSTRPNGLRIEKVTVPLGVITNGNLVIVLCYFKNIVIHDFVQYNTTKGNAIYNKFALILRLIMSSAVWFLKFLKQINISINNTVYIFSTFN